MLLRYGATLFLSFISLSANPQYSFLDSTHSIISDQVELWSQSIDETLSSNFETSQKKPLTRMEKLEARSASLDSFFHTNKFIDETEETYLRLNMSGFHQSIEDESFKAKARAQIPLSRTKKHYNLFIEDIDKDNIENTLSDNSDDSTPSIGLNFFAPQTYGIESKYSIGASGIKPFVRARFHIDYKTKSWIIQPVQQFKYSTKQKFQEETSLYFDRLLASSELLRFVIFRGTEEKKDGMDYGTSVQYFHTLDSKTALSLQQTFFGNTKYYDVPYGSLASANSPRFAGIHNYQTAFNWRQNVWKKWFFYELTPGVNFHRHNDYKPNYTIRISFDMYFGQLYKH